MNGDLNSRENVQFTGRFQFSRVIVIQSLPSDNSPTGKHLHEELLDIGYEVERLRAEFWHIETWPELCKRINIITDEANNPVDASGNWPILHFEVHGDKCGFNMADGEYVKYERLFLFLCELNLAIRNNLLVVMAACCGAHLVSITKECFEHRKCAPFWGVCGPTVDTKSGKLHDGYKAFYRELFTSLDLVNAVEAFHRAYPDVAQHFDRYTSEYLFKIAYAGYIHACFTPEFLEARVDRILPGPDFEVEGERDLEAEKCDIRERLTSDEQRRHFTRTRDHFFMCETYPENRKRFPVEFDDVKDFKEFDCYSSALSNFTL